MSFSFDDCINCGYCVGKTSLYFDVQVEVYQILHLAWSESSAALRSRRRLERAKKWRLGHLRRSKGEDAWPSRRLSCGFVEKREWRGNGRAET